jgi:cardiolipin synthase
MIEKNKRIINKDLIIQQGKNGIFRMLFSRCGIMVLLILFQLWVIVGMFHWFVEYMPQFYGLTVLFNFFVGLYLINSRVDPTSKITWLIVIVLVPVFGASLFLFTKSNLGHRLLKTRILDIMEGTRDDLPQNPEVEEALKKEDVGMASLQHYLKQTAGFPAYTNTSVRYFKSGEEKWAAMLEELKKAQHYIFMEYFIIDKGEMWASILEIMAEKARQGVDVRVIYDGTCEFANLPYRYPEQLKKLGIQCRVFAPLMPFLSTHYNYRDHRKILVIDGNIAFNGGVNLADEYINRRERFGYWKDAAVMLKGDAVRSFTLMFQQMWLLEEKERDIKGYLNNIREKAAEANDQHIRDEHSSGFVIPFADCPLDGHRVGEHVYMDILNRAHDYIYIMTPYLILDGNMENSIRFAAERGVDVRIILPGIPDKKAPYMLAKTHYQSLLEAGVKLYEYVPGFVHSKVFLSDDETAVVGTINLDYRSLYHHFECATYMRKTGCINDIKADFTESLKHCRRITPEMVEKETWINKTAGVLLKIIAPLM